MAQMTVAITEHSDPGAAVAAATALQPAVELASAEAQRLRHVPEPIVRAMAAAGLYRLCAPALFGGGEADPETTIKAIEAISEADGSVGWVLMIGMETVGIGGSLMPHETAGRLFAEHPDLVMCGALNPQGRARPVAGGFVVSGQWPFASGCHHAHYFWGQCVLEGQVGTAVLRRGAGAAGRVRDHRHLEGERPAGHRQPRRRGDTNCSFPSR